MEGNHGDCFDNSKAGIWKSETEHWADEQSDH